MSNPTYAGNLAAVYPEAEIDRRTLGALVAENHPGRVRWADEGELAKLIAIRIRAEDATCLARVKLALDGVWGYDPSYTPYTLCASYWAALP
jgi:hypothetical protein